MFKTLLQIIHYKKQKIENKEASQGAVVHVFNPSTGSHKQVDLWVPGLRETQSYQTKQTNKK